MKVLLNCSDRSKIKSVGSAIFKMTVKNSGNYVASLMVKGINAADIVVLDPTVTLQSLRIYCAGQVKTPSSSSENWFEEFLECVDVTETELDTLLAESEEDNLISDPIDYIVQAINSIRFDRPQCLILRLQAYLQVKGSDLNVLADTPILFTAFKQKLYKEFQCIFPRYSPLLNYVTINHFRWQVMCLWEFLINTPINENTYEWLQILINV